MRVSLLAQKDLQVDKNATRYSFAKSIFNIFFQNEHTLRIHAQTVRNPKLRVSLSSIFTNTYFQLTHI